MSRRPELAYSITEINEAAQRPEQGAQGEKQMGAAVAVARMEIRAEGIAAVVLQIQRSTGQERKRLEGEALVLLKPVLRNVVARFKPSARGSLEPDDLMQICFESMLKLFKRYNHALCGSTTFEQHAYREALRTCMEKVRLQAFDVTIAENAVRGMRKYGKPDPIQVESRDASPTQIDGASAARVGFAKEAPHTPEELLLLKQVRGLVRNLRQPRREYIARYFGLEGYIAQESLEALALEFGVSKSKLFREIKAALAELRCMLDD